MNYPFEFEKQYLNGEERNQVLASRIQELEEAIDERKLSLRNWTSALQKLKDSGISTSLKTSDTEVWNLQEHVEHKKSSCLIAEKKCNGIEYLLEELDYGIKGMLARLGVNKIEDSKPRENLYFNVKSHKKVLKAKEEQNLNQILKSIDEAGAVEAAIEKARKARDRKYKKMLEMVNQWFEHVQERQSMLNYFIHTKNTRMLEKYSKLIKRLSYTSKGRATLKLREKLMTNIKHFGMVGMFLMKNFGLKI